MADRLSAFSVSLDGIDVTCVADGGAPDKQAEPEIQGSYQALDVTKAFSRRDVPLTNMRDFRRGAGFVRRTSPLDDGGLAWAEDGITWMRNGLIPSGRRKNVGFGLGLGYATNVEILDSVYFGSDVWAITNQGKILKYAGAVPTVTPVENPPSGLAFNGGVTGFRSGFSPIAMAVFSVPLDGAGAYNVSGTSTPAIYVACAGGAGAWRMYQYTAAWGWAESAVLTYPVFHMAVCYWEGSDGIGAERLHINTGNSVMRHCIQGQNPLLPASYITPVTVGNQAYPILSLVAAPGHLYAVKANGIHDFNESHSWDLTPYWERSITVNSGYVSYLYDDHIYSVRNMGLDAYDLRLGEGAQQRIPGECGPGSYWQDGTPIRGRLDALADHEGWMLGALFNPDNKTTYIGRGKRKRSYNEETENPIQWHFAEQVLAPVGGRSVRVSNMRVVPAGPNSATPSGTAMLWMWVTVGFENGTYDCDLYYAPLPSGSGPLSLLVSGGSFEFNPTARFMFTEQNWDDETATAAVRRLDVKGQKVTAFRTIEIKSRTGQSPDTLADQSTWTSQGTATADNTKLLPASVLEGQGVAFEAVLTTPSPYTSAPIFISLSPRAKVIREAAPVIYLNVLLEKGTTLKNAARDLRKVSTQVGQLAALQNRGEIPYTDEEGGSWRAMVEQGIQFRRQRVGRAWRVILRLEVSLMELEAA